VLLEIPTDPHQPSMNLGQAVAVCLYELSSRAFAAPVGPPVATAVQAPGPTEERGHALSGHLDLLAGVIEETMAASECSPRTMHPANRHDLRLLLRRLAPSERDARRILGLFRRILWRLERNRQRK
jgi:tRNA/rRNA methyltransferase